jgi:hypothetical protein
LHSTVDRQLTELKAITEKTATMQLQPATTVRGGSAQGPSREEVLAKGRTNIVRIPTGSIKFPVSLVSMQVQMVHPLEVNLPEVPIDQLQEIFQQIGTELKERELATYTQNATLVRENVQLIARNEARNAELTQYEQREQDLSLVLQNIAAELPQCDIQSELAVTQKVRKIADRAKALEEEKAKMEEEYKEKIAALEAQQPATPEAVQEAHVQAFRIVETQMKCRAEEVESLLEDATRTWTELEELPEKIELQKSIQSYDQLIAQAEEEAKSLGALAKMKKKTEITQLQQLAQKFRTKQINLDNTINPHQEKVAQLVDRIEKKVIGFKASKGVIEDTEDPLVTDIMLTTAQEEVANMDSSLKELKETFGIISQEAKDKMKQMQIAESASGSGTSHK